ncbi:zinc-ribbon domain-containing protein [Microbacterium sp. VKM Ac-2923]|uniref:zinc-ribbon domain-containing protein n=1 Tax=Microbacterium sp. VKM Ac-2923 TaxID=2929476 RepID=UPI001FB47EEC|nr:zinc-ribbon domain-containing protein [Microbacterium sp. VKM Ac-2923]MCJ1707443.1 zinc-ribbon domain-containing protein [Microbacterium sp. VKM Ac-2923]
MAERVQSWWARRQWSKGLDVPYAVGAYREAWAAYPALIRQYHPDLNAGIALSQVPPAAEVLLLWQCDAGHRFAATPHEQRQRPGRERRRSAWCPECSEQANPTRAVALPMREAITAPVVAANAVLRPRRPRRPTRLCERTPAIPIGEAFVSVCAPKPASAVEDRVRADLGRRLTLTEGVNAVRVARPFFEHLEVWPDFVFPELRIAVEYDTIGRHGLEHVGRREESDRRKDRALRAAGWEVMRLRVGRLEPLGPFDLQIPAWSAASLSTLIETFRGIRGTLLVDPLLREDPAVDV